MITKVTFFEATDIGKRASNQDAFGHWIGNNASCFVVADGLGGHQHGEIASNSFCTALLAQASHFQTAIYANHEVGLKQYLMKSYQEMQQHIIAEHGMMDTQTTFAMVWLDDKQMITVHVGDSRVYRVDQHAVLWRTPDHSLVQELFEQGKVTDDEMGCHPSQNRLLRTVNLQEEPKYEIVMHHPLTKDETLILCTDGFWSDTNFDQLVKLANSQDYQTAFMQRIQMLLQNPFSDNVTVQVVKQI